MAHMIADTLSETDSANADRYEDNAHETHPQDRKI